MFERLWRFEMNERIKKIIIAHLKKRSIVYERALGAEEIVLFMLKAPKNKQDQFINLLGDEKVEDAMNLVEDFLGIEEGDLWDAMHSKKD